MYQKQNKNTKQIQNTENIYIYIITCTNTIEYLNCQIELPRQKYRQKLIIKTSMLIYVQIFYTLYLFSDLHLVSNQRLENLFLIFLPRKINQQQRKIRYK